MLNCKVDSEKTEISMSGGSPEQIAVEACCVVRAAYHALERSEWERYRESVQKIVSTEGNGFWDEE